MKQVDQIIHAAWILPMHLTPAQYLVQPDQALLADHALVIDQGRVLDIKPSGQVSEEYRAEFETHLADHILMPGLINAHTHAAMNLFRGFADDLPLQTWLEQYIWPAESRWVSDDFVRCGTQLAVVESLLTGTTCFNDMYFFPEVVASVAKQLGFRVNLSPAVLDFPSAWAKSAPEYIEKTATLIRDTHSTAAQDPNALVQIGFGPHAPYTVGDKSIELVAQAAVDHNTWIHMHLHETQAEVRKSQETYGCTPLSRLQSLGVLSERFQAVHMTALSEADLQIVQENRVHVVHCPESNLKLASGFCPVSKLLDRNVNLCLGTDSAASNNNLNMFSELRTASLLAKAVAEDAAAFGSYQTLYAVTQGAARCFQQQDKIGSLEPGKQADVIAVNFNVFGCQPCFDPISHLVYAVNGNQVSHVWVAGQCLLDNRSVRCVDVQALKKEVTMWRDKLTANT